MKPSILVLGGGGMLGHKMFQVLSERFPDTHTTVRGKVADSPLSSVGSMRVDHVLEGVDAMQIDQLQTRISALRPDFIVNCVGTIKQREQAKDPIESITINSLLPHRLSSMAAAWKGRVIHFSTDCVFSGTRGGYSEEDQSDALDLYGRTKFLGEVSASNALTLRTSIIGRELIHHTSLLDWFLAQDGKKIRGFTRAWWSGVTTLHLSNVVAWLIDTQPSLSGLYQLSSGKISKYDLLVAVRDAYGMNVEIEADSEFYCDRSLLGQRFNATTGYVFPGWDELLDELTNDRTPYRDLITS